MHLGYFGCFFSIFLFSGAVFGHEIKHWQTTNGSNVYFVASDNIPIVDINLVFDAGSARDKIAGVAQLSNSLLTMGAKTKQQQLSADDIAKKTADLGAKITTSTHRDMAVVALRSLSAKSYLEPAVDLFTTLVAKPSFEKEHLEREKQRSILYLENQQQQPGFIASRALYRKLYQQHPYAKLTTSSSISSIMRLHVERFHSRYYIANNATIAIVGNLSLERAKQLANKISSSLPTGKAVSKIEAKKAQSGSKVELEIQTLQSHILLGQVAISRNNADYYNLYVGNHILGGSGFGSRLMKKIREDCGMAYSVYSYFAPMAANGPFIIGMQTKNSNRDSAYLLLKQTLGDFIKNGPTKAELDKALLNITGSEAMRTDSNAKLVSYLAMIGFYDLPLDYLRSFNQKVSALSVDSIRASWQKHINLDNFISVIAGDLNAAQEQQSICDGKKK